MTVVFEGFSWSKTKVFVSVETRDFAQSAGEGVREGVGGECGDGGFMRMFIPMRATCIERPIMMEDCNVK